MLHDMSVLDLIQCLDAPPDTPIDATESTDTDAPDLLINAASSNKHKSLADIRKVLSSSKTLDSAVRFKPASDIDINETTYRRSIEPLPTMFPSPDALSYPLLLTEVQTVASQAMMFVLSQLWPLPPKYHGD